MAHYGRCDCSRHREAAFGREFQLLYRLAELGLCDRLNTKNKKFTPPIIHLVEPQELQVLPVRLIAVGERVEAVGSCAPDVGVGQLELASRHPALTFAKARQHDLRGLRSPARRRLREQKPALHFLQHFIFIFCKATFCD